MSLAFFFSAVKCEDRKSRGQPGYSLAMTKKGYLIKYTDIFDEAADGADSAINKYKRDCRNLYVEVANLDEPLDELRIVSCDNGPCNQEHWKDWGFDPDKSVLEHGPKA